MTNFEITIFEYQKFFFNSKEIISIVFKGNQIGEVTILYDHSPIIVDLNETIIKCKLSSGKFKTFWIEKGIFSFDQNKAKVMTNKVKIHQIN